MESRRRLFSGRELLFLASVSLAGVTSYLSGFDYALAGVLGSRTPMGVSLFGSSWYYLAFETLALVFLAVKNRRAAVSLVMSVVLLYLMQVALSEFAPRERPAEAMEVGDTLMELIRSAGASSSFFSGHTATAVAVYVVFQMLGCHPLLVAVLALPVLVSRLMLVQHYLSDVAGGVVLGYVTAKVVYRLVNGKSSDDGRNQGHGPCR